MTGNFHSKVCDLTSFLTIPAVILISTGYLLVSKGVHVADDLSGHLASVCGAILEGSLDDGHDESQGGSIDKVDKLGVQQRLQACLRLSGRISESIQQDGGYG